jgi:thiosulfate/3-mercaptopyruvate sulfurtransferase
MTENLLVSTAWLAEHLLDPNLRVVDIRGRVLTADQPLPHYYAHRAEYDQSHLPGAVFVDWTQDIVDPASKSQDIASPERYAALMSKLGIGDDTFVVAYDDASGMFAARMWWTLNYYGHENVAVLDGGWQKWLAENLPVTDVVPQFDPATFTPRPNSAIYRTAADVQARGDNVQLMDVRTVAEFTGKTSRAKRFGHIPGALNLPRTTLVTPEGTMLPPDELKQTMIDAGIKIDAPEIITYCNGGVSASYGYLALRVAGIDNAAVYDGSWKDWGNDDAKPIE